MQKITPHLWFDSNAEEAVNFYVSIFKNSKITSEARYGTEGSKVADRPEWSVMTMAFELDGQEFLALNGGPVFTFSPATSFMIHCDTQEEIDHFWEAFSDGGKPNRCGWIDDRFGVTWQVVPRRLGELMQGWKKAEQVMGALMKMNKIDIKALEQAAWQQ